MKIAQDGITPRQLLFCALAFVQGSSLLTSFFSDVLKQNSWLGVLVAYLIGLPILLMYLSILNHHPGKNLTQINELVFGRVAGKIISACYIFYFFTLIALNTYDVHSFIISYMMPETPPAVIALLFMLIPILLVRKGMDGVARVAAVISIVQIVSISMFALLLLKNMHPENLLPFLHLPVKRFLQGTHTILSLPFCELVVFMMIIPSVQDSKKAKKNLLLGYTFGAIVLLTIVIDEALVLGRAIGYFSLPGFETIRLINLADTISRMDTLYALLLYMLRFLKVSVLLYACSLAFAQTVNIKYYRPLVPIIGILASMLSIFIHESSASNFDWGKNTAAVFSSFFNLLLPLCTYIIIIIRGAVRRRRLKPAPAKA